MTMKKFSNKIHKFYYHVSTISTKQIEAMILKVLINYFEYSIDTYSSSLTLLVMRTPLKLRQEVDT